MLGFPKTRTPKRQPKPMNRGKGFKRPEWSNPAPKERPAAKPAIRPKSGRGVIALVTSAAPAQPKESVIEHEGYRRLVAARPCKRCGIQGLSQAAHPPPTGKAIKQDDRLCSPLCCTRTRIDGCHVMLDRYRLGDHTATVTLALRWAAETRAEIIAEGQWPSGLERWSE